MKNIDRIAKFITENGSKSVMVHTVPKTNNWIVCQKIEIDKWLIILCNPMSNVTYNLGTVTDAEHINLWDQLMVIEIENKMSQILLAKDLKERINKSQN